MFFGIKRSSLNIEGYISLTLENTLKKLLVFKDIFEKYSGLSGKKIKLLPKERELGFYQIFPQQYLKQENNGALLLKKCMKCYVSQIVVQVSGL